MSEVTVSFDPTARGWTSFHSYYPEWMLGMNSVFYTFYQGKPWKHYSNSVRNSYYGAAAVESSVRFVFNDEPTEAKMFKTLELESLQQWTAELVSDLHTGSIENTYFVLKEGSYYANVRRDATETGLNIDWSQISTQGVGSASNVIAGNPVRIEFSFDLNNPINPLISAFSTGNTVGDVAYYDAAGTLFEIGVITAINRNSLPQYIEITNPSNTPAVGNFIFVAKNPEVESYGLRGHYAEVTLTNLSNDKSELFAVNSEIFKSYP